MVSINHYNQKVQFHLILPLQFNLKLDSLLHLYKEVDIAIAFFRNSPHHFKAHVEIKLLGSVIEVGHG